MHPSASKDFIVNWIVLLVCLGYIVTNVEKWCGYRYVKFDECPNISSCPPGKMVPTDAFWKALSAHVCTNHFASSITVFLWSQETSLIVLNISYLTKLESPQ